MTISAGLVSTSFFTTKTLADQCCYEQHCQQTGNALKALGDQKGRPGRVQLLNCPELMQSFFAAFKIGATLVPINPSLPVPELAYIYQDAGLSALISNVNYLENIKAARKEAPKLKEVIMLGASAPDETLAFDKIIEQASDVLAIEETDNDDTAVMIYTAGTTGNPKGVMLTHFNWYTHVSGYFDLVLLDTWGVTAKGLCRNKTADKQKAAARKVRFSV